MELLQLQYFNTIVDMGSMTAAAETLHVSQSTLSCSIKKLEGELETKLFQKQGRYLVCTDAGKLFYEKARDILDRTEALTAEVKTMGNAAKRMVRVVSDVVDISSESSALLTRADPGYTVETTRHLTTAGSHQYFLSGKADFLITSEELHAPGVLGQLLFVDPMLLLVSVEHPLARRSEVSVKELSRETFVTLGKGTAIRALHDEILHEAEIKKPRFYIVNEPEALAFCVSKNLGIAFLPQSVRNLQTLPDASFSIKNVTSVWLKEDVTTKKVFLYWSDAGQESESVRAYRAFIQWYGTYVAEHGVLPLTLPK